MIIVYGNTLTDILLACSVVFLFLGVGVFARTVLVTYVMRLSQGTKTLIDDFLLVIIRSFGLRFYGVLGVLIALYFLIKLPDLFTTILEHFFVIFIAVETALVSFRAVDFLVGEYAKKLDSGALTTALPALRILLRVIIITFGLIFVLSNFGVNITALLAGVGVVGLAISFAFQKILTDLFSTFVIFFDKPFSVGDSITADGVSGTVEKVGIKTTDIRAFTGERIVVPNQDLVNTKIYNKADRSHWRVTLSVPVSYTVKQKNLAEVPGIIESVVASHENVSFSHAHIREFGEHAVMVEVVYKVRGSYAEHAAIRHAIHVSLLERFSDANIDLGYPIQAVTRKRL